MALFYASNYVNCFTRLYDLPIYTPRCLQHSPWLWFPGSFEHLPSPTQSCYTAQRFCGLHKYPEFLQIYFTCDSTVRGLFQRHSTPPTSLVTLSFNNCIWIDLNCHDASFYYLHTGKALQENSESPDLLIC